MSGGEGRTVSCLLVDLCVIDLVHRVGKGAAHDRQWHGDELHARKRTQRDHSVVAVSVYGSDIHDIVQATPGPVHIIITILYS